MAKAKTTGEVNQRSDRWFVGGVTTLIVSGLLTISWRVYTAGKIPFWSAWPGILGVAIVGAAFFMIAIGVRLGQDGNGPGRVDSNEQRQAAATDDSTGHAHKA
jgi:hypothetical protein